mmetsp:Transcript_27020/g.62417  ORF Transcript_27020/g.62417 Transcript_27020/m.62417 type:complete len:311 (+) Transcript_27020:87-1019(+)
MAPAARQTLVACALLLTPAVFQVCAALKVPSQVDEAETLRRSGGLLRKDESPASQLLCELADDPKTMRQKRLKMLLAAVPDHAAVADRLAHAHTCAVVSNSGVLLAHSHGRKIDDADVVFRFNDAPLGGDFAEAVGYRDDIRIVNNKVGTSISLLQSQSHALDKGALYLLNRFAANLDNETLAEFNSTYPGALFSAGDAHLMHEEAHEILAHVFGHSSTNGVTTTGFEGVILAMSICDEVHAYGFPDTSSSKSAPFHYFGDLTGSASENKERKHAAVAALEKKFYRMVASNSDIDATDTVVIPGFNGLSC